MRYWIIPCSVLFGLISFVRTGDFGLIISSLVIGAGIGVVLYGLFVTLTSAVSSAGNYSNAWRIKMHKFLWLIIFLIAVVLQATKSNLEFAVGATIPWYIAGVVFSPIWWGVTKKNRKSPWKWFDWLNTGAYIMIILFVLSIAITSYMSTQVHSATDYKTTFKNNFVLICSKDMSSGDDSFPLELATSICSCTAASLVDSLSVKKLQSIDNDSTSSSEILVPYVESCMNSEFPKYIENHPEYVELYIQQHPELLQ